MQLLYEYKSRRNHVELIRQNDRVLVRKRYHQRAAWAQEQRIYETLSGSDLPHAEVISAEEQTLLLTRLSGRTLAEILDTQEETGRIDWMVWEKLVNWFTDFYSLTGHVMTDVNLRNFLYDEANGTLYGVDFEECTREDPLSAVARLAAFIRTYTPEHTPLKQEIAGYVLRRFSYDFGMELQTLFQEAEKQEALLRLRRMSRK